MDRTVNWEEPYRVYRDALAEGCPDDVHFAWQAIEARAGQLTDEDWDWFRSALADPPTAGFVLGLLRKVPRLPPDFLPLMLHAAILHDRGTSAGLFLPPCLRTFGARAVIEGLVVYLEQGSPAERLGAAHALYDAEFEVHYREGWIQPGLQIVWGDL